jgi:hypothetical protein
MMSGVEQRLAEIEARLAAATQGPWGVLRSTGPDEVWQIGPIHTTRAGALCAHDADVDFVAYAVEDVRWLSDQLRQARDLLAKFAALNPIDWHETDDNDEFCVATPWFYWCCDQESYSKETLVHSPDCPWVAARAMLSMEENAKDAGWHTDYLETRDPKGVGDVQR